VERGGGVEAAGEGDADLLAEREGFKNDGHVFFLTGRADANAGSFRRAADGQNGRV
jgi:hypothetical protein